MIEITDIFILTHTKDGDIKIQYPMQNIITFASMKEIETYRSNLAKELKLNDNQQIIFNLKEK